MGLFILQNFTAPKRPLRLYLLTVTLIALTACEAAAPNARKATSNTSFEAEPPPNFTRGLLARRTVEPLYPLRAKNLGIEGWVMLRFSVDESGAVINNTIQMVEEQPAGYFELASVTAARRLRFENTRGETVEDVRYVFRYELEESNQFRVEPPSVDIQFRELLPLRLITPDYPPDVEQRGIEGYVIVRFTVTDRGVVQDIVIDASEPPGIFDNEALAAATRLRFDPRIVSDVPVQVEDVLFRFDWRLPR
jgi:TonB family protein